MPSPEHAAATATLPEAVSVAVPGVAAPGVRPRRVRRVGRWAAVVLGAAGCLAAGQPARAARQPTPAQKEAELRKLNDRIDEVRKSVNADVARRDKLSVQLREAELGVAAARHDLDEIRAQRITAEARLRDGVRVIDAVEPGRRQWGDPLIGVEVTLRPCRAAKS